MTGGALRKYTDRDVRENPDMRLAVTQYLEEYEGEFEFLIDMKMRLASNYDMTVGMVRGVLNCMRHDPRVTNLPEPMPEYEGKVLQMPTKSNRRRQPKPCDIEDFHFPHGGWDDPEEYEYCEGKYAINRTDVQVPAIVKVPWVTGQSGKFIHTVGDEAWFMWRVMAHAPGWRYEAYGYDHLADFYVRPVCIFPRLLTNPIIFGEEHLADVIELPYSGRLLREWCPRCFPEGEPS